MIKYNCSKDLEHFCGSALCGFPAFLRFSKSSYFKLTGYRSLVFLLVAMLFTSADVSAQSKKERNALFESMQRLEVSFVDVGVEGTKLLKVWGFARKKQDAVEQAKKNAVFACVFRGIPGTDNIISTPSLCRSINEYNNHEDYFYDFFKDDGLYLNFVNVTSDGMPTGVNVLKVKKGYKVGVIVQVMYDNLRTQLEEDGIIEKFGSGF